MSRMGPHELFRMNRNTGDSSSWYHTKQETYFSSSLNHLWICLCFLTSHQTCRRASNASTYPAGRPACIAAISLGVSSEYRPMGELYCLLWAGLTAAACPPGKSASAGPEEALRPFTCTDGGVRRGRRQEGEGAAENTLKRRHIFFLSKLLLFYPEDPSV